MSTPTPPTQSSMSIGTLIGIFDPSKRTPRTPSDQKTSKIGHDTLSDCVNSPNSAQPSPSPVKDISLHRGDISEVPLTETSHTTQFNENLKKASRAVQNIVRNFDTYYTNLEKLNRQVESYNIGSGEVSFATLNPQISAHYAQLTKLRKKIETHLQDKESSLTGFEKNTLDTLKGEISTILELTTTTLDTAFRVSQAKNPNISEEDLNKIKSDMEQQESLIRQLQDGIVKSSLILALSPIKRSFMSISSGMNLPCTLTEPSLDLYYNGVNINTMNPYSLIQNWIQNNVLFQRILKESTKFGESDCLRLTETLINGKLCLSLVAEEPSEKPSLRERIASVFRRK